jgi:tRNA pseudouridine65 synthase
MLEIVYEDPYLIAVNKPHGLFVHRTVLDYTATEFALQMVRDMVGNHVYSIHRLDRKTAGVLLFAKDKAIQSQLAKMFIQKEIDKKYLAIVRGYTPDLGTIEYPLVTEDGKIQDAITHYTTISRTEIPFSSGKFATSRYSLIEVNPETGRMHQIRRHMSHIFHPIIADRPHGCNKQNRFFIQQYKMDTMMLHASRLTFTHPINLNRTELCAKTHDEFNRMISTLGFEFNTDLYIG